MNSKFKLGKLWVVIVSVVMICSQQSVAQSDSAAGKIAVVSVQKAVLQTERAKTRLEKLKKQEDYKSNLKKYEGLETEFKKMVEKYQSDRAVMNAEKIAETEKRLKDKNKDLQWLAQKLQQAEKEWAERMMQDIGEDLASVLKNIVREQKIGLLLRADSGVVMSADDSYDISDQVTERLNQIK